MAKGAKDIYYKVSCKNGDGSGKWTPEPPVVQRGGKLVIEADNSTPGITVGGFDPNVIANIPQPNPPGTESIDAGHSANFNIKGVAADGTYSFNVQMNNGSCVFHNDPPTFEVES